MPETLNRPPELVGDICWLPRHPRSVGEARKLLRGFLAQAGDQLAFANSELVISELVANAVEHARVSGRLIAVRLELLDGRLWIEVHDASEVRPVLGPLPDGDADSGRGLWLVEALAEAWGCAPRAEGVGKFVWALVGAEGGVR